MKKLFSLTISTIILVFLISLCSQKIFSKEVSKQSFLLDDFEKDREYIIDIVPNMTSLEYTLDKQAISGNHSLMLTYTPLKDFKPGYYCIIMDRFDDNYNFSDHAGIILYYKSQQETNDILRFSLLDEEGNLWSYDEPIKSTNWNYIFIPFDALFDNPWDYNISPNKKLSSIKGWFLQITMNDKKKNTIWIDKMVLISDIDELEKLPKLKLETDLGKIKSKEITEKITLPKECLFIDDFSTGSYLTDFAKASVQYSFVKGIDGGCIQIDYKIYGESGYYVQVQKLFDKIMDFSKYTHLCLWVKGDRKIKDQLQITFFEQDGDWWSFTDSYSYLTSTGKWEFLYIPLEKFEDNPWDYTPDPGEMDLSKIKGFRIQMAKTLPIKKIHTGSILVDCMFLTNLPYDEAKKVRQGR